jgi:hypothetical protein
VAFKTQQFLIRPSAPKKLIPAPVVVPVSPAVVVPVSPAVPAAPPKPITPDKSAKDEEEKKKNSVALLYRMWALAHFIMACVEAYFLATQRYSNTTVPQAIIVAKYWRSWLLFVCVFHFMRSIFNFLFSLEATLCPDIISTFVAFPAIFIARKIKSERLAIAFVVTWLAGLWLIPLLVTVLFWLPNAQGVNKGMWQPGCAVHSELCDAAIWETLGISAMWQYMVMWNMYNNADSTCQAPVTNCLPVYCSDSCVPYGQCNITQSVGAKCDPYFGLGFVQGTAPCELIYCAFSLLWFIIWFPWGALNPWGTPWYKCSLPHGTLSFAWSLLVRFRPTSALNQPLVDHYPLH